MQKHPKIGVGAVVVSIMGTIASQVGPETEWLSPHSARIILIISLIGLVVGVLIWVGKIPIPAIEHGRKRRLEIIGGLEDCILEGTELLAQTSNMSFGDAHSIEPKLENWRKSVDEYLQRELYDEFTSWFKASHTAPDASLGELISGCKRGLDMLEDLLYRLNSSISHKESSQN